MPAYNVVTRSGKGAPLSHSEMDSNWTGLSLSGVYVGSVMAWMTGTAPDGWLIMDGSAISRTTYSDLFSVIGSTYGDGDGTTTFNLPDTRGMFLRGVSGTSNADPDKGSRTDRGDGTTGNNVGTKQGDQLKSHQHSTGLRRDGDAFAPGEDSGLTSSGAYLTENTGGNETRPKNIYVNWIIRAL